MPEKLLSIKEVAECLNVSEEEVKRLVDIGEIPAYKIGDTFLRFRKEQIDAIRQEISDFEESHADAAHAKEAKEKHPYTDLERDIKRNEPIARQYDYTPFERIKDFFYFNDFYILCFIIIAVLTHLILKA
ncbi:MAG: helix-turn-helix domain-containing protein [Candidatus Omnitrophota bacterium]|nr:helix-turn-helix domain-containing protein [Candidatus Omnitrophota bacterium]